MINDDTFLTMSGVRISDKL